MKIHFLVIAAFIVGLVYFALPVSDRLDASAGNIPHSIVSPNASQLDQSRDPSLPIAREGLSLVVATEDAPLGSTGTDSLFAINSVDSLIPESGSLIEVANGFSASVYVQVYKAGVTDGDGQGSGIICQVYWSPVTTFGGGWNDSRTNSMQYFGDVNLYDKYRGVIGPLASGKYELTARCSDDGGATWTWAALPAGNSKVEAVDGIGVLGTSTGTGTGVLLSPGTEITITAMGSVNTYPESAPNPWGGPIGNGNSCVSGCLLPSAQFGALIGRIGNAGNWFFVGNSLTFSANRSGELVLAVNDTVHDNNDGSFVTFVASSGMQSTQVDLTVSLYRSVSGTERLAYEQILGYFADAIYEMSNGANKIRNITIYQNGAQSDVANVVWNASEWPRASVSGYGRAGAHVWIGDVFPFVNCEGNPVPYDALLPDKQRGAGYALGHELGHYYFGLYDEYKRSCAAPPHEGISGFFDPASPRTTDLPVTNSVMNAQANAVGGDFNWLNFSISKNDRHRTAQFRMYRASGWETLARPTSQDPRTGDLIARTNRTYYPELANLAPGVDEDSSLELPAGQTQARSDLHITWVDSNTLLQTGQATSVFYGNIRSIPTATISYPQPAMLVTWVARNDPIAEVGISATVESPDNTLASLLLKDDGDPPDVLADDGLYSGIMPYQQNGTHTITVTLDNNAGNAEFTQASAAHATGPNGETYSPTVQLVGENFHVVVTSTVVITNVQADDHGDTPQTATTLLPDNVDVAGRVDRAGDADVFKVTASQAGTLVVRVSNLALEMQPKIRLLKADGVTVIGAFDFQPQADAYFLTTVNAKMGEAFYVEVSHHNSSATAGLYAVSSGSPLAGEIKLVYLPLIMRTP